MINLMENLCRTCMQEQESMHMSSSQLQTNQMFFPIFKGPSQDTAYGGSITLKDLLLQATPKLSICINDPLPKSVCKSCLDQLMVIHEFQQKCLLTEQRLQELANELVITPRLVENGDDPLTHSNKIEGYNEINDLLKIEMDEPLIDETSQTQIATVTHPVATFGALENEICDTEMVTLQSNDLATRSLTGIQNSEKNWHRNQTHEKKKEYPCSECNRRLKTLKSLKRHEILYHRAKDNQRNYKKIKCSNGNLDIAVGDDTKMPHVENSNIPLNNKRKTKQLFPNDPHFETYTKLSRHRKMHHPTKSKKDKLAESDCTCQAESGGDTNHKDVNLHGTCKIKNSPQSISSEQTDGEELQTDKEQYSRTELKDQIPNDDKPYECDECGSRVKTRKSLKRHKRIHQRLPGERPQRSKTKYECKYCQKVFCQSSSLNDHMRVHTGERPFLCSECGRAFKILSNMKQHLLRHGTDRPYECPNCPKRFPCLTDLASHAAVHNKAKTHVCDICGSAFVKPYLLKKHKMYHTGEKKHKCDYCDMRFVLAEQCRRHMRTHTGEKPYKCKYCTRAFAQSNDLTKHLRVHLGDSVYRCDLCPQGFRLLGDLRSHFNNHKSDDEDTRKRNLLALREDEQRLQIKFGLVQAKEESV